VHRCSWCSYIEEDGVSNEQDQEKKKIIIIVAAAVAAAVVLAVLLWGGAGKTEYELTVSGRAKSPGVISFLGYDINVYRDQASNPCGDCEDQPVHLYMGDDGKEAARAIAACVRRANDVWEVKKVTGSKVILREKKAGAADEKTFSRLDAPAGMTISDNYDHKYVGKGDSTRTATTKTVTDLSGDRIRVPYKVDRIGAVYGPSYEALYVLGQQDKVVVSSDVQKEDFPWATVIFPELKNTPELKNVHSSVNVEKLMTYKPDLVFSFPRPNEMKQLEEGGIAAVPGETTRKLKDVPDELLVYAHCTGKDAVDKAKAYGEYFDKKYDQITARTRDLKKGERPKVYYSGIDILTTYGGYSDIPDLIEKAGGTAVSADLKAGNHAQIDFEQLAAWDPDYIFLDHGGMNEGKSLEEIAEETYRDKKYSEITAVKDHEIHMTPTGVFYWDMGLQKILLLEYVAKTIHPGLFKDLDMVTEIQQFYRQFYRYDLSRQQAKKILERREP
jgi:iron complex transport system substrate-binding protein